MATYTQEQLKSMTIDQLVNIILQGQTAAPVTTDQTITVEPAATPTSIQADIAKIKDAIANLEKAGENLFSEEISNLKQKLSNAEAEAAAKFAAITGEVMMELKPLETEAETLLDQIRDKYLPWAQGAAVVIVLLKVFGVI